MLTLTFEVILSEIIKFSIYTSGNRGVRRMIVLVSFHLIVTKDSYLRLLGGEKHLFDLIHYSASARGNKAGA